MTVKAALKRRIERIQDKRAFTRAAYASHHDQTPQWKAHRDIFQIVAAGAAQDQKVFWLAAGQNGYLSAAGEVIGRDAGLFEKFV
jgi:hypothetical protein